MTSSLLLVMLWTTALTDGPSAQTPWFCKEGECPRFSERAIVRNGVELRLRDYESAFWVTTEVSTEGSGFWTLFNYIGGNNSDRKKVDMTAPVINVVQLSGRTEETAPE